MLLQQIGAALLHCCQSAVAAAAGQRRQRQRRQDDKITLPPLPLTRQCQRDLPLLLQQQLLLLPLDLQLLLLLQIELLIARKNEQRTSGSIAAVIASGANWNAGRQIAAAAGMSKYSKRNC